MLGPREHPVFSKRAALRSPIGTQHATGHLRTRCRRRKPSTVGGRRAAERPRKARRERPDALQADREADVSNRSISVAQQRRRPLQSPRQQVGMGRLAECPTKLATEMGPRQPRRPSKLIDPKRLKVPRISEVFGAQQMPCGGDIRHCDAVSRGRSAIAGGWGGLCRRRLVLHDSAVIPCYTDLVLHWLDRESHPHYQRRTSAPREDSRLATRDLGKRRCS
jgi:hypothetical protein